jgi:hypothetical protein
MKTIHKYELPVKNEFSIEMPEGAELLTVQVQCERPCIWALVDADNPMRARNFRLHGTGHQVDASVWLRYVGTFQLIEGTLVLHLFEVVGFPEHLMEVPAKLVRST